MFKRILIANRGEIACRIIRAAKALGIETVAVYSDADRLAQHVRLADAAYHIGPAPSRESYLRQDRILEVAKASGADAIHPGYGFLSENAAFRQLCDTHGIAFIGPSAEAMRLMGDKTLARRTMEEAGVPVVPGTTEPIQDLAQLESLSQEIGYPIMLKASAGGGGKGMRIVPDATSLKDAFEAAQREAAAAFGDDSVYIEKAIVGPRHIEIQVFCDAHGQAVYVGDRECSVQRRHQKVIEEAPAPNLRDETRRAMGDMACKAALAVNYLGAGTIECLVDKDENFYFLEMNTRLQVEHCVTEAAYGVDLAEAQILVAAGQKLPWTQDALQPTQAALEFRLYAEDPGDDYRPSPGPLHVYRPPRGPGIRVDDGVIEGDEVSSLYDPMIAKLIVSADTRDKAIARARVALAEFLVEGIDHNLDLCLQILDDPAFQKGQYTTQILDKLEYQRPELQGDDALIARVLAVLAHEDARQRQDPAAEARSTSAWAEDGRRRQLMGLGGLL